MKNFEYDPKKIIEGAISVEEDYCTGYQNPGASGNGYITTIKLSTGTVNINSWSELQSYKKADEFVPFDQGCAGIVSYDRCECNDAYIGAINMLTASSFSGLQGVIWGYDIAKAEHLKDRKLYEQRWPDGYVTSVFDIEPLLNATERLYGHADLKNRRFNPMPGSMVVCANKSATSNPSSDVKKGWAFSFIALSILEDRNSGSNLFIEDCDIIDYINPETGLPRTNEEVSKILEDTYRKVTECVVLCGMDQKVRYTETFIGYRIQPFNEEEVGCALACAPYVTLARKAIPPGYKASDLTDMTISDWEFALGLPPLEDLEKSKIGYFGHGVL